jgi:hypothetical protein
MKYSDGCVMLWEAVTLHIVVFKNIEYNIYRIEPFKRVLCASPT